MLAVTCFQCGHSVEISPDDDRCGVCGASLRRLIGKEQASRYFYMRAADLSAKGDVPSALAEVQRGLAYQPSSELHLLGAILCKRQGKYDEMRHHVAAVPVDDILRGEAEWLLRSSQARQRSPADAKRAQEEAPLSDDELLPALMEEVRPSSHPRRPRAAAPALMTLAALAALLLLGGWWLWQTPPAWLDAWLPAAQVAAPATEQTVRQLAPPASTAAPVDAAASEELAPEETPLVAPTPAIAPDLVANPSEPLAAASPEAIIVAPPFDLKTVLIEAQRPDLADTVNGRMEGGTLVVEGTVQSADAREQLLALLKRLPTVEDVSIVNVLVRPPGTYTVKEGDTLWNISMELYGTPDRIQDLFEANQDILPSADALRVGMILQVPPAQ